MSEFVEYLHEIFEPFGPIQARRMFGGHGIYHDGLMFALVADDVLYLKADGESAHRFEEQGLGRFEYVKNSRTQSMSYYLAPEAIFDDPEEARAWARVAWEAAVRARDAKPGSKRRR